MEILAKRMRELRNEKRIWQEEMASILGVSVSAYRNYETNKREPTAPLIAAFADYFDVSADYLLGRSDQR